MPENTPAGFRPVGMYGPEVSRDIKDGACLTCLAGGDVKFPLDPRHHVYQSGHVPDIADLPALCTALGLTAERWEALAEAAVHELTNRRHDHDTQ
jgi:hypothetical protein